jgi:hypothetical protein
MTAALQRRGAFAAVLALWLLALVAVWPVGEFPLFDDWVYAYSAFELARAGSFRIPELTSAVPLAQAWWGRAFVEAMGASHLVLRLATVVAALVGALCWQRALRMLGLEAGIATWAVAVALFSPAFIMLAPTFMSDVPFVAACQAALLAGLWWARRPSHGRMALAALLALVAAWVRQPGAALLLALLVTALGAGRRAHAVLPAAAIACVAAGQVYFARELGAHLPLTERMSDLLALLRVSPGLYLEGLTIAAAFVGLCAAPAAIAAGRARVGAVLVALAPLVLAWLVWGPPVLREGAVWGACELGGARSLLSGAPVACASAAVTRFVAVLLSAIGLAAIVTAVRDLGCSRRGATDAGGVVDPFATDVGNPGAALRRMHIFVVSSFAVLAAGLSALWLFADRYWVVPAAAAPALVLRAGVRRPRAGAALLAAYALVGVLGARDTFALYARVNALADALVARGVPIEEIDAGYAVNAWRRYLPRPSAPSHEGRNTDVPWVTAVAASPWTIANRLEPGWRCELDPRGVDTKLGSRAGLGTAGAAEAGDAGVNCPPNGLVVERLRHPWRQRASSEFGTAGWRE